MLRQQLLLKVQKKQKANKFAAYFGFEFLNGPSGPFFIA